VRETAAGAEYFGETWERFAVSIRRRQAERGLLSGPTEPGRGHVVANRETPVAHTDTHEKTLADKILERTGVDVRECYQCGKCTAGCPMVQFMDLTPSQVMRLAQIGDRDAIRTLLASQTLWSCVGCLTCTQRCPKDLDPAAVMDALREIAYEEGLVPDAQKNVLKFHEAFLKTVEHTGRMSEVPLTALYKTLSRDFFSDVLLAPAMLLRGKLPLVPRVIGGRKEVRRIFKRCLEPEQSERPVQPEHPDHPDEKTEEGRP